MLVGIGAASVALLTATFGLGVAIGLEDASAWEAGLATLSAGWALPAVVFALAADLVLPIPSSLVMTWSGHVLGFAVGTLASSVGALAGSVLGYEACRAWGRPAFVQLVGEAEQARTRDTFERWGAWLVLLSRPVPMLAETIACLAGVSGMDRRSYLALTAAGTVPICAVYGWVGSQARSAEEAGAAVLVALLLPGLGLAAVRWSGVLAGPVD